MNQLLVLPLVEINAGIFKRSQLCMCPSRHCWQDFHMQLEVVEQHSSWAEQYSRRILLTQDCMAASGHRFALYIDAPTCYS